MERIMKKLFTSVAFCLVCIFTASCFFSSEVVFGPRGESMPPRKGSIAILCGHDNEYEAQMAEEITLFLAGDGRLSVLSQKAVKSIFPSYPTNFLVDNNNEWTFDANREVIRKIHEKLKTDYIFVVWIMASGKSYTTGNFTGKVGVGIAGWLIKFPEEKIVSETCFTREDRVLFTTVIGKSNDACGSLVEEMTEEICAEIDKKWK